MLDGLQKSSRKEENTFECIQNDHGLLQANMVQQEEEKRKFAQDMMRDQGIIPSQFRVGELRVRQILLGDPKSPETAKVAPTWSR